MKKKITFYLEPHNDFLKDVKSVSKLMNYLLDKEFGEDRPDGISLEDDLVRKIIKARKLISNEDETEQG